MDAFDYSDVERPRSSRGGSGMVWNILTILVLLTIACVGLVTLLIFVNPRVAFNPFPPPTEIPTVVIPTATNTPLFNLPPTYTPTMTREPTSTDTPRPTWTPLILFTDTPVGGAVTPQPGGWGFVVQQGTPVAMNAIVYHPEIVCDWMGVAGRAFGLNGEPVPLLLVQLGGTLEGRLIETQTSMTGVANSIYGQPGFFEFTIANHSIASQQTLWIQLVDQQNLPLSDKIYFDTFDDCEKNLILINFTQVK